MGESPCILSQYADSRTVLIWVLFFLKIQCCKLFTPPGSPRNPLPVLSFLVSQCVIGPFLVFTVHAAPLSLDYRLREGRGQWENRVLLCVWFEHCPLPGTLRHTRLLTLSSRATPLARPSPLSPPLLSLPLQHLDHLRLPQSFGALCPWEVLKSVSRSLAFVPRAVGAFLEESWRLSWGKTLDGGQAWVQEDRWR